MITDFDDFVTWMYVLIDEIWQRLARLYQRPGPQPICSDSELITMAIVGECREWDKETNLMQEWRAYRHLFPQIPERSRFNRRRRNLMDAINHIRRIVLQVLDVAQDHQCVMDSLPVPVVQFHLGLNCISSAKLVKSRAWTFRSLTFLMMSPARRG